MLQAVRLTDDDQLVIIDQTRLPGELREIELRDLDGLCQAIYRLQVRGAPAIGVCAGYGVYMLARQGAGREQLLAALPVIRDARPTAVNLAWALGRMGQVLADLPRDTERPQLLAALRQEAVAIAAEDEALCQAIGQHGAALIRPGDGVLTHCNAGALAASGPGTALAPMYAAFAHGVKFTVYCDETRPLLQGARLTAWELSRAGVDTVLICDNMAASLMAAGRIQKIFVGADRIAANGDVANKIGTLSVAVNANHFGVPFYVCAPSSTIDPATTNGQAIPIEQRPAAEVTDQWYETPLRLPGVRVCNPAFDVTPAALVTAIITEAGVLSPPYEFRA